MRCAWEMSAVESDPAPEGGGKGIQRFAGYELLEEIGGDGAMGSVYRAMDPSSGRVVALKTVRVDRLKSAEILARFRIEIASAANLDHPHVLPILDTGEHEGQYYYTMRLATGGSLARQMARGRWTVPARDRRVAAERQREIARLLLGVAEGVHHAHERGILHRDLKPANILLDEDGTAYVSDFGLAKQLDSEADLTRTQGMVGTPSYMAPEQAIAGGRNVTARTDVWALGAILYELLTGQPPFEGDGPWEVLEAARTKDPVPPTAQNPCVDLDLSTICLKCLEKDPERRYGSASELASELRCVLGSLPIRARPPTQWESVIKWYRRNPVVALLILGLWLSLGLGSLVASWQWWIARETATRERAARLEADAIVLRQRIERADYELDRGRISTRLANLAAVLRQQPTNRFAALSILHTLTFEPFARPSIPAFKHGDRVVEITLSPDDRWVATASYDRTARIWDAKTGQPAGPPLVHPSGVESVRFHPSGRLLASGDQDGAVRLWSVPDGRLLHELKGHTRVVSGLAFTSNGRRLVSGSHDQTMRFWDPVEGRLLANPGLTNGLIPRVGISADDDYALAAGFLSLRTPGVPQSISDHLVGGNGFVYGSERSDLVGVGTEFATGSGRMQDALADVGRDDSFRFVMAGARDLRFSPDDLWLAYAEQPGYRAVARRTRSLTNSMVAIDHEAAVWHVVMAPAGDAFASVSSDGTARIRSLYSRGDGNVILRQGGDVSRSAFSWAGPQFYTSSLDGTGQGWQLPQRLPPEFPEAVADRMIPKIQFWSEARTGLGADEADLEVTAEQPEDEKAQPADGGHGPEVPLVVRRWKGKPSVFVSTNGAISTLGIQGHSSGTFASGSSKTVVDLRSTNISIWRLGDDGRPRVARWSFSGTNPVVQIWGLTDRFFLMTSASTNLELRSVDAPGQRITAIVLSAPPVFSLPSEVSGRVVMVLKPPQTGVSGTGKLPLRVIALADLTLLASREVGFIGNLKSLELAPDGQSMLLAGGDGYSGLWSLPDLTPIGAPFRSGPGSVMVASGTSVGPSAHYLVQEGRRGLEWVDPLEGKRLGLPLRTGFPKLEDEGPNDAGNSANLWRAYTPIIQVHPSGRFVAVARSDFESEDLITKILPSLPQWTRSPSWLPMLAEGVARERIGSGGRSEFCPTEVYLEAVRKIGEDPVDDDLRRWGRWFVREGMDKPVHPWTKRTVGEEVARLSEGTLEERMQALQAAPGDARVHVRLAEQIEEELPVAEKNGRHAPSERQRAEFLRERAVLLGEADPQVLSRVLNTIQSNAPDLNPVIALRKITRKRPELLAFWQARMGWELSGGNIWEVDECATNLVARAAGGLFPGEMTEAQRDEFAEQVEFAGYRPLAARLRARAGRVDGALTDYRYVDLTDHQNAARESAWHNLKDEGNTLKSLDRGWLQAGNAPFVVSEVIQVLGTGLAALHPDYPKEVRGIRVGRTVQHLHFLQGTGWAEKDGVVVGRYRVRYEGGESIEIPIRYGFDVRNWQYWPEGVAGEVDGAMPVWKGPQERWKSLYPEWGVRLYAQSWRNPHPEKVVESVDFESAMSVSAPFLVGLTAEISSETR